MRLWGGRFSGQASSDIRSFLDSFAFDVRLARHDVLGSIAHARMLARQGIISPDEASAI